jgi:hypothetical protein
MLWSKGWVKSDCCLTQSEQFLSYKYIMINLWCDMYLAVGGQNLDLKLVIQPKFNSMFNQDLKTLILLGFQGGIHTSLPPL